MSFLILSLLFAAAAMAGALNSVAGGGSFIAFPALLFAGVAPVLANATNTVALWPGGVASVVAYRREIREADRQLLVVLGIASLIGGWLGARLLLHTSDQTFIKLLPWLLLVATLLFTFGGKLTAKLRARPHPHARASAGALAVAAVLQLVISVYGGYFGGGMGIMMLATLSVMGMTDIHAMNGLKTLLGALINGIAVVEFVRVGAVAWRPGAVMIVGAILGGYFGAALARKAKQSQVRALVMVVAWGMTVYFFIRAL